MRASRITENLATLLLVGVVTAACSSGSAAGPDGVDPAARRDAIREARSVLGEPAVALASATDVAVTATTLLREELPEDPARRRSLVDAVVAEDVAPLQQAIRAAEREARGLAGRDLGVADVDAALVAFQAASDAATDIHGVVRDELAEIERVAEIDEELAAIVAAWAEGGSRSQLLNRFAELAEQAQTLAESIGGTAPVEAADPPAEPTEGSTDQDTAPATDLVPSCAGPLERRRAAAVAVAGASEELRQLVLRRRGNELDERMEELVADPYGTGSSLAELDRSDAACWAEADEVAGATAALATALEDLQQALNPSDLSEAPSEG